MVCDHILDHGFIHGAQNTRARLVFIKQRLLGSTTQFGQAFYDGIVLAVEQCRYQRYEFVSIFYGH